MKAKDAQLKGDLTNDFLFAVERAATPLNKVQQDYAYSLPNNLRGVVLKLHKSCISINHLIAQTEPTPVKSNSSDAFARHLYLGLFNDIKKLVEYTQKL